MIGDTMDVSTLSVKALTKAYCHKVVVDIRVGEEGVRQGCGRE